MKSFTKTIGALIMALLMSTVPASAEDHYEYSDDIPEQMEANTIIRFVDNHNYVIEKGSKITTNKFSDLNTSKYLQIAKDNGTYETAYTGELPKPVKGLKVYYADDGYLLRLVYPKNVENPLMKPAISKNENLQLNKNFKYSSNELILKEGPGPNDVLLYKWGAHNNQIWKTSEKGRLGYGRATTFSDRIGERDNILKKGDCATALKYDNPPFGTIMNVAIKNKNNIPPRPVYHELIKRDVGTLPDAVIDIWKTGVEYWGYTWTSTLSINNVQYLHNRRVIDEKN